MTERHEPKLSVVVPVYDNASTLPALHARIVAALQASGLRDYEVVYVSDASPDGSFAYLCQLAKEDEHVVAAHLAENQGQNRAVLVGLALARGEYVVTLDADLQDPPEAIPVLLGQAKQADVAAVFAGRRGAYESPFRLLTSKIYKGLQHWLTRLPADAGLFVLLRRDLVNWLLTQRVEQPTVVTLIGLSRMPVASCPTPRSPRAQGRSAYTTVARLRIALHALALACRHRWGLAPASDDPPDYLSLVTQVVGRRGHSA